jgi:hypothetical protein
MGSKPNSSVKEQEQLKDKSFREQKLPLTEKGIIQPFRKSRVNNDTCGINRDKNPCGDASDY